MTREERQSRLKAFITCLKCEVSGKCCDDNCLTQYEAGNMGEIIENLEAISKVLEQEQKRGSEGYMTRKEALEYFKNKAVVLTVEETLANAMAINALEQEPCEDCVSRKAAEAKLKALVNEMETIFADIRESKVDDSVCGLCEYDCDHGLDGFANECPGFERDDCFKLKDEYRKEWESIKDLPSVKQEPKTEWIPVNKKLPKTDNKNTINKYNVLLWVKDKTHPEEEPQIYLGKLRHIDGDDGSGNFWGLKTKPCEWTIWGWSYFFEPEVIAWQPLPKPYKAESEE